MSSNILAESLKLLRVYKGMPQWEMAKKMGVVNSLISEMEKGRRKISPSRIEKYSEILEISVDEILDFAKKFQNHKDFQEEIFRSIISTVRKMK